MTSFEWILKNRPEVDVSIYFKKFYRSLHQMMWQDEPCENVPVYRVVRIDEPDFGCEGRPDGAEPMAKVYLESEDGEKTSGWNRTRCSIRRRSMREPV